MEFLESRYGKINEMGDELIQDNVSESGKNDDDSPENVDTHRWKRDDETYVK